MCPQRWACISKNEIGCPLFSMILGGYCESRSWCWVTTEEWGVLKIISRLSPPPWGRCLFWECIILSYFTPTLSSFWSPTLAQVEEHDPWRELGGGRVGRANLSMKEGGLFCNYEIHRTGMLQIVFVVSLESSRWGGVHGLGSVMFGLAVQKFLNIEWFLHWKLN